LWGEELYLLLILSLCIRWGEWSTSRPGRFSPEERTPGTHCTGGWVGHRAGLDTEARGKIFRVCRGSNLDRLVVQPVARHYTDWATGLTYFINKLYKFCLEFHVQWNKCCSKYYCCSIQKGFIPSNLKSYALW
jgi:hypothetical protein